MKINWHISQRDVDRVKKLVKEQTAVGNHLICYRKKTNLSRNKSRVTPTAFWHRMVSARITTQNKSGPGTRVDELSNATPFPLSLRKVRSEGSVERFIAEAVRKLRFHDQIAKDLAMNLDRLENRKSESRWKKTLNECNRLTKLVSVAKEREVATYIHETFQGFGPKQSRNLLQMLGLTRYEIPIDSRVTAWLNEFDFPVKLNATVLGDRGYYEFVSDGVQELCRKADVHPCIFDAAVFASQAARPTNKNEEEQ